METLKNTTQNEAWGRGGVAVDPDSKECLAKKKVGEHGTESFYLRFASGGAEGGLLYDFNSSEMEHRSATDKKKGVERYQFRKVAARGYEAYVRYLKTENKAHLRVAQRNIVD